MTAKERIVEAAFQLFGEKGFTKVSVAAICKQADSSKGGFYHHFSSKEDVVQTIINNYVYDLEIEFTRMTQAEDLDVFYALANVFDIVNTYKVNHMHEWPGYIKMLTFEGNGIIIQKMTDKFNVLTTKTYKKLLEIGNKQEVFHIDYVLQMAKLFTREITSLYTIVSEVIMNGSEEKYQELVDACTFAENFLNSQLGLSENKVLIKDKIIDYVNHAKENMPDLGGK